MKRYKDYKTRFHNWQLHPMTYEYLGGKHCCDCCGEEHEGNFCPLCGQKATHGPITWKSVWVGWLEIWGLHSRSLPYTAWQLLMRPGYLMRDYITGKRQVSFPPVKMLVILGIIVYMLGHWVSPQDYSHEIKDVASNDSFYYVKYAFSWLQAHEEWFALFICSFLILPTWLVFRNAPLIKRHSLPQGFFIQTFIAIQIMVLELICMPIELSATTKNIGISIEFFLAFIYLFVDYKQLFGYSWWGTIWRLIITLLMVVFAVYVISSTIYLCFLRQIKDIEKFGYFQAIILPALTIYLMIHFTKAINTRAWRIKGKWAIFKGPLIVIAIMLATLMI